MAIGTTLHLWFLMGYISDILARAVAVDPATARIVNVPVQTVFLLLAVYVFYDARFAHMLESLAWLVGLMEIATAALYITVRAAEVLYDGYAWAPSYVGRAALLSPSIPTALAQVLVYNTSTTTTPPTPWWAFAAYAATTAFFAVLGPIALASDKTTVTPLPRAAAPAQVYFGSIAQWWVTGLVYGTSVVGRVMTLPGVAAPLLELHRRYAPAVGIGIACVLATAIANISLPFALSACWILATFRASDDYANWMLTAYCLVTTVFTVI